MQAMLSRLVTAGNDGPVATALRLPSRLRLLGHLLDGESAASLQSLSARESLLRLLREISSHHALPETLPGEADLFEGSTTLRVPADSIMVDASHELGLYAQVSTVDASGCFASAEEAASAAAAAAEGELVSLWLPVTTMGDFDLADRTVTVSYDPESVAAAVDADRAATRRTATPESAAPRLVAVLPPDEVVAAGNEVYEVSIVTSDIKSAGTDAHVSLCLMGEFGVSGDIPLQGSLGHSPFQRGSVATFHIARPQLGALIKMRLGHDGAFAAAAWHVQSVDVRHLASGECYGFDVEQWIVSTIGSAHASVTLRPSRTWTDEPQGASAAETFASRALFVPAPPLLESGKVAGDATPAQEPSEAPIKGTDETPTPVAGGVLPPSCGLGSQRGAPGCAPVPSLLSAIQPQPQAFPGSDTTRTCLPPSAPSYRVAYSQQPEGRDDALGFSHRSFNPYQQSTYRAGFDQPILPHPVSVPSYPSSARPGQSPLVEDTASASLGGRSERAVTSAKPVPVPRLKLGALSTSGAQQGPGSAAPTMLSQPLARPPIMPPDSAGLPPPSGFAPPYVQPTPSLPDPSLPSLRPPPALGADVTQSDEPLDVFDQMNDTWPSPRMDDFVDEQDRAARSGTAFGVREAPSPASVAAAGAPVLSQPQSHRTMASNLQQLSRTVPIQQQSQGQSISSRQLSPSVPISRI